MLLWTGVFVAKLDPKSDQLIIKEEDDKDFHISLSAASLLLAGIEAPCFSAVKGFNLPRYPPSLA